LDIEGGTVYSIFNNYKDIKVEYASYRVHIKDGNIESVNGNFLKIKELDINPKVDPKKALMKALKIVNAKLYAWESSEMEKWIKEDENDENATFYPEAELVIWNSYGKDKISLAYKFNIYSLDPPNREFVFINAHTGELLDREQIMKSDNWPGIAYTRYSGVRNFQTHLSLAPVGFYLIEHSRGLEIYTKDMNGGTNKSQAVWLFDNNNTWTDTEWHNEDMDDALLDIHWGAQMTYDYFHTQHNRHSYDDDYGVIGSYVHFYFDPPNAKWDGDHFLFGDDAANDDVLATLDIFGHEFGHAICTYTCDLRYQRESGAIDEGLSDIWGACVEEYIAPEKQEWRCAEELTIGPIRAMDNPNLLDHPDTYGGNFWINPNCGTPTRWNDYCGVHTNCGVMNYWFYLLSVGGNDINDNGDCYYINGIGMTKASKIVYKMERDYLDEESDFADARTYSIQAARNLYGTGSNEEKQVTNAWFAVGVGNRYPVSGPNIVCTSNSTFSITNTIPPSATVSWAVYPINLVTPYSGNGSSATFHSTCSYIGNATITFTITNWNDCSTIQMERNFVAGGPDPYDVELDILYSSGQPAPKQAVFLLCPNTTYHIYIMNNSSCSTSNYVWTIPSTWIKYYQYNNMISINTNSQPGGQIMVDATTCCTNCSSKRILIDYVGQYWDCGGGYYMASPNPADSYIDIDIDKGKMTAEGLNVGNEHVLTMIDKMGMVKYKVEIREFPYRMNTSNLPNGLYVINLINENREFSIRVMIEH
jgi:Zn-dependent metalloprotease